MHRSRIWPAVALGVAFIAAACAAPGAAPTHDATADAERTPSPSVSISIGPDGRELPEDVVEALNEYGAEHADEFGGLYVEDQGQGSFVMLFTDNLDEHAAALAEIWPRVTVRGVRFAEAELREIQESFRPERFAGQEIELLSAGVDIFENRVVVTLLSDDPTLEARLELEYGGRLDAAVHPFPGEWSHVAEGDGWRLLATGESRAEAYTVRAATDEEDWEELWAMLGFGGDRPEVAFADEVVVTFGHGISSSCPEVRLDDVEITGGVVYSVTSDPLAPRGCNLDLSGAAVFVVAVERDALPKDEFTLQLARERVTGGGFTEVLEVPLR